jgi:hypothetical protein
VARDGKATQVPITLLFDDGANAAIAGKLNAGDAVIIEGQLRVVPDGKVRVLAARGTPDAQAAPDRKGKKP